MKHLLIPCLLLAACAAPDYTTEAAIEAECRRYVVAVREWNRQLERVRRARVSDRRAVPTYTTDMEALRRRIEASERRQWRHGFGCRVPLR